MFLNFYGIKIVQSEAAGTYERVREHVKRRTQPESYHRRIDKKWRKRYGLRFVPGMYMIGGHTLVAHPSQYALARKALEAQW